MEKLMERIIFMKKAYNTVCLIILLISISYTTVVLAETETVRGIKTVNIVDKAGSTIASFKGSYALIIGVNNYQNWPKLPGVEQDIVAVEAILQTHGFTVDIVRDPTKDQLLKAIDKFIDKYGRQYENRLIFYFAGHGYTTQLSYGGDMGYIVPVDAPNPNKDLGGFKSRALNMQQIEVYAKAMEAKHALFLFDSCFSGSIFSLSRAMPANISYKTAKPVRQFITSGSANETVPDKSVFREQFVAALKGEGDVDGDGYVTGGELGEFLQKNVVNYTMESQHPQYGKIRDPNLDKGDFVFALNADSTKTGAMTTDASKIASTVEAETIRLQNELEKLRQTKENLEEIKRMQEEEKKLKAEVEAMQATPPVSAVSSKKTPDKTVKTGVKNAPPVRHIQEMTFARTYGENSDEMGYAIIKSAESGYVLAGFTDSSGNGEKDMFLVKTDFSGEEVWRATFGGKDDDVANSVLQSDDGGYIILGTTRSFGAGNGDMCLVKTDGNGKSLWERVYGGDDIEEGKCVVQSVDGTFTLFGNTETFGAGDNDFYLVKTDSVGKEIWSRTFGGDDDELAGSMAITSDGGYIMVGSTKTFGSGRNDLYVVRADDLGNELWAKVFGGEQGDYGASVIETSDGGFLLLGQTKSFEDDNGDIFVIKIDKAGGKIWTKTIGGDEEDYGYAVRETADGDFIIAGETKSFDAKDMDAFVAKLNKGGELLWKKNVGGDDDDSVRSIILTADGGFAMLGYTYSFGKGWCDFYFVKTDADGAVH